MMVMIPKERLQSKMCDCLQLWIMGTVGRYKSGQTTIQVRNAPKNPQFESITQLNAFTIIVIVFHVKIITTLDCYLFIAEFPNIREFRQGNTTS
jgi:hypothetical protein